MKLTIRGLAVLGGMAALAGTMAAARPAAQDSGQRPRPGLTAAQTKQAVELARGTMKELRRQNESASAPEADRREYIVNVELLDAKDDRPRISKQERGEGEKGGAPAAQPANPRAVVTSYRYFDDTTFFSTIDLATGKVVDVQAGQHVPTPLSDGEFDEAVELGKSRSDEVKKLYEKFGDQLTVYPQFAQYVEKGDARRHRVVHLNYRVGKRDLSYPRPQVDLTTRTVVVPEPEADPGARVPRRGGAN